MLRRMYRLLKYKKNDVMYCIVYTAKFIMDEKTQKLYECVYVGSTELALNTRFVSSSELIEYLSSQEISTATIIAYRSLCNYGCLEQVCEKLPKYKPYSDNLLNGVFITNGNELLKMLNIGDTTVDQENLEALLDDNLEYFKYNVTFVKMLLLKFQYFNISAPLYFTGVMIPLYKPIFEKIVQCGLLTTLTQKQLKYYNDFYPGMVDVKKLSYDDLCYKISNMDNEMAGYILGFPIHEFIPDNSQIEDALMRLQKLGKEEYIKSLDTGNYHGSNFVYANNEDVLMVKINKYLPFDIFYYRSGKHVYRYTRPEFKQIINTKKDFWTNNPLPISILKSIEARYNAAKHLGLPKAKAALRIYQELEHEINESKHKFTSPLKPANLNYSAFSPIRGL